MRVPSSILSTVDYNLVENENICLKTSDSTPWSKHVFLTLCLVSLSHFPVNLITNVWNIAVQGPRDCKTPCGESVVMFTNWKKLCSTERIKKGLKLKCLINISQPLEKIRNVAWKWCVSLVTALLETLLSPADLSHTPVYR